MSVNADIKVSDLYYFLDGTGASVGIGSDAGASSCAEIGSRTICVSPTKGNVFGLQKKLGIVCV